MTFDEFIGMTHGDFEGSSSATVTIEDHHRNPTGNINGGVFLSMADNVSTGAANRAYFEKTGERKFMVGVDLHAVMLANQQGGTVRVVSRPVRVGRRITVIRSTIFGDDDRVLCEVTTTHVPM
ncbi:MAG: PaaI family thioesterase [Dehalococcoidia bacterium]